ncbi:MAG: SAM-dependent methyltransferase [Fusobacteriaceae bacterium]|nr:SAM-dependent methyltransferase [Fusobacteriaceae bacterium]
MKTDKEMIVKEMEDLLKRRPESLVKGVFSDPVEKSAAKKCIARPFETRGVPALQFETLTETQAFHENLPLADPTALAAKLSACLDAFSQLLVITEDRILQYRRLRGSWDKKESEGSALPATSADKRRKGLILPEGVPVSFLVSLGIMGEEGRVRKDKYDKFRQINKYLEFIDDTIRELRDRGALQDTLRCVDFGCGKSYLTFALEHYLRELSGLSYEIRGLDLKEDVIDLCNDIAENLGCGNLSFLKGDIRDFSGFGEADLVFSLHACDNATDYAIEKALALKAKAILLVPCCQHEFYQKIGKTKESPFREKLPPLARDGILAERFAALATDAYRAQTLRVCGYSVRVMEFIDMEHTPKNILIRAIKTSIPAARLKKEQAALAALRETLGIRPLLDKLSAPFQKT